MKRAALLATGALAALAALPAIAEPATVSSAGTSISYGAAAGETNNVDVDDPGSTYTFAETPITAGAGCTQTNANLVTCSDSGIGGVVMQMGDMNDTASATGANEDPFLILGGSGDDTLTASAAGDAIAGGPNGPAGDEISGSAGSPDTAITEGFCTVGIFVSINDVDDDGGCDGSPFTDDVHTDVENLQGSDLNDTLIGNSGSNGLRGLGGNDLLDGGDNGAVSDSFTGDSGIDRVVFGIIPGHTYACTSQPVSLDMDNSFDDASCADAASDFNNVRPDIESVTGSTLGDTITGSCFANTFAGDPGTTDNNVGGNDTFNGDPAGCLGATSDGTEADFMGGGEGNDIFNGDGTGNAGVDTVTYGAPYVDALALGISISFDDAANDNDGFGNATENVNGDIERLIGNAQNDTIDATAADQDVQLFGRLGNDLLVDGPFNDLLNGEGGTDTANCPNGGTNVSLNNEAGTC